MKSSLSPDLQTVIEASHYRPAVSLILPFEPKMVLKSELTHSLKIAMDKAVRELEKKYPDNMGKLVMQKLHTIIRELNYSSFKKSIAIYVSPVFEKVLYLDINVKPKVVVGDSFEIRDLVFSKVELQKFLVLLLSGKDCRMYLANGNSFTRIVSKTPGSAYANVNDAPERVSNFSDKSKRKEILMEKFLHHIDSGLEIILNAYPLPLFVLGTERILGHFKSFTRHDAAVVAYVPGNYEESSFDHLWDILQPYVADWQQLKQKDLLRKLEEAADKKKLATGMQNIWDAAINHKGRLLAVEKDYVYREAHETSDRPIGGRDEPYNNLSYMQDVVDDTIEKVLEYGGEVEFVEKDVLKDFGHIALVKYY